jgi:hypothetical protein
MKKRFQKVLGEIKSGLASGWQAGARQAAPEPTRRPDDRFTMKPGEVEIIRGGGTPIDRAPGESRGDAG